MVGYELLAACMLTCGRPSEVLGVEVGDVSFDRQTITFRPNSWRRLKNDGSARVLPLWPQHGKSGELYREAPTGCLLFQTYVKSTRNPDGTEAMTRDVRKLLDAIAGRIGYKPRELNLYAFRHTYCAARLQTPDNGAPVSPFTGARELRDGGDAPVRRICGHLGTQRNRSEQMEYRVEQHAASLGDRLAQLRLTQRTANGGAVEDAQVVGGL